MSDSVCDILISLNMALILLTRFPTKIPAVVEEVDKRGIPGPTEYFTLEKRMEAMAKARGGLEFRRQFFQHLQRMRDRANQEHKDCDKSVRAFMADKLTWNKFCKFDWQLGAAVY